MTHRFSITQQLFVFGVALSVILFAGVQTAFAQVNGCATSTQTLVSDDTNTVVGDTVDDTIVVHPAWTAAIPGATWIWKSGATAPNETVAFEQTFTVVGTVLSAQLQIASDNNYRVLIDGVEVALDANINNFTLAEQDTHDLTVVVTPGTHTLRIEVTNVGTYNADSNPAGLLYKLVVESEECPPPPPPGCCCGSSSSGNVSIINGFSIVVNQSGCITNTTSSSASTGGNSAGGSTGGNGGRGGDVRVRTNGGNANGNNGAATAGAGGVGGAGGPGGVIVTGGASSSASTVNLLNRVRIRINF